MNLSSNQLRIIVIAALALIVVGAIVLVSLDGGGDPISILDAPGTTSSLRSYSGGSLRGVTPSTDPCTLLTKEVVERELGLTVGSPQSGYAENPLGERFCRFPDPGRTSENRVVISIVFNGSIDPALLNDGYNVQRMHEGRKASPDLIQVVDGLGDDAFWGGSGQELWNGLHVLIHDLYVQVDVSSGDSELDYRVARNLAVTALEQLFGK